MSLLAVPRTALSCLDRPSLVPQTLLLVDPARSSMPLSGPPWDRVPLWIVPVLIDSNRAGLGGHRALLCGVMLSRDASHDRASEG